MTGENTWTNEFGDRIMCVETGNMVYSFVATNKEQNIVYHCDSLRWSKVLLNRLRKGKIWAGTHE